MKPLELSRWRLHGPITGRLFTSRYAKTGADALDVDPLAVRLPCSNVVHMVPENDDEMDRLRTSTIVVPRLPTRRLSYRRKVMLRLASHGIKAVFRASESGGCSAVDLGRAHGGMPALPRGVIIRFKERRDVDRP